MSKSAAEMWRVGILLEQMEKKMRVMFLKASERWLSLLISSYISVRIYIPLELAYRQAH
jgi:hypothetical protein